MHAIAPLSDLQLHAMLECVETERQERVPPVLLVSVGIPDGQDVVVVATVEVVGLTYELSSIPLQRERCDNFSILHVVALLIHVHVYSTLA